MSGTARRRSREAALQVLYAVDLGSPGEDSGAAEDAFAAVGEHFELPEGARAFAKELVFGVVAQRVALDERIEAHASNWRLGRMAAVDRNVLRLAAFELAETDTPTEVVIDEAVRLAARFAAGRSPAFVNGVLDALAHDVRGGQG